VTTSPDDSGEPDDADDARAIDAAFDEIIANIDAPGTASSSAPWPPAEGETDAEPPSPSVASTPQRTPRAEWDEWDDIRVPTPASEPQDEDADEDDEHYVPPPPPPLPKPDRVTRWAWAGAVGAPALAIVLPLIGWGLSDFTGILLVIAFLSGFGYLVSRMRTGPRTDDGPDDGAVV
jgi:hypothetical protein